MNTYSLRRKRKLQRSILIVAIWLSALAFAVFAQDKPSPKVPVVTDTFKAKFFKAQAQAEKAQNDLQQTPQFKEAQVKQQVFQSVVSEFQALCGKDFTPQLDPNGDPGCAPKPPAPKEPKK